MLGLLVGAMGLVIYVSWMPLVHMKRVMSVSGTYARYVWNTWEKILRLPAGLVCLLPVVLDDGRLPWGFAHSSSVLTFVAWLFGWYVARSEDRDDDDDWFKKTTRRLRTWRIGFTEVAGG